MKITRGSELVTHLSHKQDYMGSNPIPASLIYTLICKDSFMWNQKKKSYAEQLKEERIEKFGIGSYKETPDAPQKTASLTAEPALSYHKRAVMLLEKHGDEIVALFLAGATFDEIWRKFYISHAPVKAYLIKRLGGKKAYEDIIIGRINAGACGGKGSTLRAKNKGLPGALSKRYKSRAQ